MSNDVVQRVSGVALLEAADRLLVSAGTSLTFIAGSSPLRHLNDARDMRRLLADVRAVTSLRVLPARRTAGRFA
jgi:hypothetical protein